MAARFSEEFRADVLSVVKRGEASISVIARDFGISETAIRKWLHREQVESGLRSGLSREETAEIRDLKRRNRLLEMENEVLRKAAAYLAQGVIPK